jgi:Late embryogenesis abundant protein
MRSIERGWSVLLGAALVVASAAAGCSTLRGVEALREVDFTLDRVTDVHVAGVAVRNVRSVDDLDTAQGAQLAAAALMGDLPLDCIVVLRATNPPSNAVTAELMRMDWSLLLDGRKAAAGRMDRRYSIAPGETQDVAVPVAVNLGDLLRHHGPRLLRLALALAGEGSSPVDVTLRVVPLIDTPLGTMRSPVPITIMRKTIGADHSR